MSAERDTSGTLFLLYSIYCTLIEILKNNEKANILNVPFKDLQKTKLLQALRNIFIVILGKRPK